MPNNTTVIGSGIGTGGAGVMVGGGVTVSGGVTVTGGVVGGGVTVAGGVTVCGGTVGTGVPGVGCTVGVSTAGTWATILLPSMIPGMNVKEQSRKITAKKRTTKNLDCLIGNLRMNEAAR